MKYLNCPDLTFGDETLFRQLFFFPNPKAIRGLIVTVIYDKFGFTFETKALQEFDLILQFNVLRQEEFLSLDLSADVLSLFFFLFIDQHHAAQIIYL